MGLGKAWKKKREKFAQSLNQAAQRANELLDEAAGTTQASQQQQGGGAPPSFLDKLNFAARNMQHAAMQMQQYDYEVVESDEATGQVTKVTIRDKTTGKIVSRHSHIQERDGTIRVSSTGLSDALMLKTPGELPPSFPQDCTIEYTMHKGPNDEHAVVECKVKDGPQAGKTLEYNVREGPDGGMTYNLVRETQSKRKKGFLLVVLGALVAVAMSWSAVWDGLCMPATPWLALSERSYEAPWWVPPPVKPAVFKTLCGDRPRTVVTYEKGQLSIRRNQKILHKKNGVQQAILSPGKVTLIMRGDKTIAFEAPCVASCVFPW